MSDTIFKFIPAIINTLSEALTAFKSQDDQGLKKLDSIIDELQHHIDTNADAAIASIHLLKSQSPLKQSIDMAILSHLLSQRLNYTANRQLSLLRATLTANFSYLDMQVLLHMNRNTLSEHQLQLIQQHPIQSADILKAVLDKSNTQDSLSINIILQHHEKMDGTGYPNQLGQNDVLEEAMIVGLMEFYTAMIEQRAYRATRLPKDVLQMINKQNNERPEHLGQQFIRMIGIYPPGSFVELANQEVAIVTQRNPDKVIPKIKAIFDANKKPYLGALERNPNHDPFKIIKPCELPGQPSLDLSSIWG